MEFDLVIAGGTVVDAQQSRRADVGVLVSPAARDLDAARVELVELRAHQDFERGQAAEAAEILKQEIARLQHQLSELRKDGAEAHVRHLSSIAGPRRPRAASRLAFSSW